MKKQSLHFKKNKIGINFVLFLLFTFLFFNCHNKNTHNNNDAKNNSNQKTDSVKNANITNEKVSEECNASLYYTNNIKVDSNNRPLKKNQYYFPLKLFPEKSRDNKIIKNKYDTFKLQWYSEQLYALKEPLLYNKKLNKEVYRFTWLRTFHHPIAIRIEKENESYKLYWKLCDGAGGYKPGKLIIDKIKTISKLDWDNFLDKYKKLNFWNYIHEKEQLGCDGAEWILEGATPVRYYVISEWEGKMDCCIYLLKLTELNIPEKEMY